MRLRDPVSWNANQEGLSAPGGLAAEPSDPSRMGAWMRDHTGKITGDAPNGSGVTIAISDMSRGFEEVKESKDGALRSDVHLGTDGKDLPCFGLLKNGVWYNNGQPGLSVERSQVEHSRPVRVSVPPLSETTGPDRRMGWGWTLKDTADGDTAVPDKGSSEASHQ
ncbi:hypothetical protein BD324DRAFT_651099 [Kockovaella imperatae]|uniref:Uncharacterized protein n=1 Tax=Kockovaella imperatae TaxID=4999 RepID=A0A1Y1UEX3_9TREE|nr:hypothetical protein BD324DRAFT_651099 [Kockovaella imperatae]ORX36610.1 hypothetical protein BD324DRAFT_651099 [Kockovaella imperatae]